MSSMMSVGGLVSGLDTTAIVKQLVALERLPITQTQNKQSALRAVDSAWSGIVSKLSTVRTALDELTSLAGYGKHTSVSSSSDAVAVTRSGAPSPGGLSFTVTRLASTYQGTLTGPTSLSATTDLVGDGTLRIKHADGSAYTQISTNDKTLAQVATAIHTNSELQVNASVQKASDGTMQLVLSSRRSGTAGGLVFDLSAAPASLNAETELYAGRDALLTMGSGADALEISSPTNRVTNLIDGVTVDLKQATTTPVTVEVQRDTAVTVEKVEALVKAMNEAISALRTNTAYDSATGARGKLQGDSTATGLRFALSGALGNAVKNLTGKFTSGAAVGFELERDGSITLDADALSEALAEDYEGVLKMFTAPAKPAPGQPGPGLFPNLDAVLKQYEGTKGRIAAARKGLTDRIAAYDDQIERYEVKVALRERMLRAKWSGLENSLSVVQSQGSTLMSALGFTV